MPYMERIQKTIDFMEENLFAELTLKETRRYSKILRISLS